MKVISARNVNDALASGLLYLFYDGIEESSRNGPVIVAPGPVTTLYRNPRERILWMPERDANPFFHLFESLWMLAGRNDVAFPAFFAKQMSEYSDDGKTMRGAYGYRWRKWFGYDQLNVIVAELKRDPASRRCVLDMWDGGKYAYPWRGHLSEEAELSDAGDLLATTKDKPCNTHIYVDVRGGALNITVCCRSNDIWWGAYGANAVHFSFLQEYLATMVGVPIGRYWQISNNYHIYTSIVARENMPQMALWAGDWNKEYDAHDRPHPLIAEGEEPVDFSIALQDFLRDPVSTVDTGFRFLNNTARPMYYSWYNRKNKLSTGMGELGHPGIDPTWKEAARMWISRREAKKQSETSK